MNWSSYTALWYNATKLLTQSWYSMSEFIATCMCYIVLLTVQPLMHQNVNSWQTGEGIYLCVMGMSTGLEYPTNQHIREIGVKHILWMSCLKYIASLILQYKHKIDVGWHIDIVPLNAQLVPLCEKLVTHLIRWMHDPQGYICDHETHSPKLIFVARSPQLALSSRLCTMLPCTTWQM